jgi:hypothetical protein
LEQEELVDQLHLLVVFKEHRVILLYFQQLHQQVVEVVEK